MSGGSGNKSKDGKAPSLPPGPTPQQRRAAAQSNKAALSELLEDTIKLDIEAEEGAKVSVELPHDKADDYDISVDAQDGSQVYVKLKDAEADPPEGGNVLPRKVGNWRSRLAGIIGKPIVVVLMLVLPAVLVAASYLIFGAPAWVIASLSLLAAGCWVILFIGVYFWAVDFYKRIIVKGEIHATEIVSEVAGGLVQALPAGIIAIGLGVAGIVIQRQMHASEQQNIKQLHTNEMQLTMVQWKRERLQEMVQDLNGEGFASMYLIKSITEHMVWLDSIRLKFESYEKQTPQGAAALHESKYSARPPRITAVMYTDTPAEEGFTPLFPVKPPPTAVERGHAVIEGEKLLSGVRELKYRDVLDRYDALVSEYYSQKTLESIMHGITAYFSVETDWLKTQIEIADKDQAEVLASTGLINPVLAERINELNRRFSLATKIMDDAARVLGVIKEIWQYPWVEINGPGSMRPVDLKLNDRESLAGLYVLDRNCEDMVEQLQKDLQEYLADAIIN